MNGLIALSILTTNILGSFQDPFEFEGDYGSEVNQIRNQVFELVVSKEALAKNLEDSEVKIRMGKENASGEEIREYRQMLVNQAREIDRSHGPTLGELVTPKLFAELIKKQDELASAGFSKNDLEEIIAFIRRYEDKKIFYLFRNVPSELLALDKAFHDKASREEKNIELPILGSTQTLKGQNSTALKRDLLHQLLNEENLKLSKPKDKLNEAIKKLDGNFLRPYFGEDSNPQDLQAFSSPAGQLVFYWLYQALNLHLISEDPRMIGQINLVKDTFARTLGNSQTRAELFREKIIAAGSGVLFTQESDAFFQQALLKGGKFLPVDNQRSEDGTFIFLRSDIWKPDYQVVPMDYYEGYLKGRVNVILATTREGEKFLLASGHGNSTRAEDGRLQISLVMEKFEALAQETGNEGLQLIIGIDANTKTEEDVKKLKVHLDTLGLVGTHVGPTTVKRRMVTVQHAKAGRLAIDEEDYLIILKPEKGGRFSLTQETVGFIENKPDMNEALPNVNNPSDHYPVGAIQRRHIN